MTLGPCRYPDCQKPTYLATTRDSGRREFFCEAHANQDPWQQWAAAEHKAGALEADLVGYEQDYHLSGCTCHPRGSGAHLKHQVTCARLSNTDQLRIRLAGAMEDLAGANRTINILKNQRDRQDEGYGAQIARLKDERDGLGSRLALLEGFVGAFRDKIVVEASCRDRSLRGGGRTMDRWGVEGQYFCGCRPCVSHEDPVEAVWQLIEQTSAMSTQECSYCHEIHGPGGPPPDDAECPECGTDP